MYIENDKNYKILYKHYGDKYMKKKLILVVFFVCIPFAVFAQGFYFDGGIGFGKAWTKFDGDDFAKNLKDAGFKVDEMAVDFSLKFGYGPLGGMPLYFVGELGGVGHQIKVGPESIQFNSYLIGPGVVYYVTPLIQLGCSLGYSFVDNTSNIGLEMYDSKSGFAWNISGAVDLGQGNHGCLIGLKYYWSSNKLETSNAIQKESMISVFVKYRYYSESPMLFE